MAQPSLKITHVATGLSAELTSFKITDFQDALSTNYNKETVFGRMDLLVCERAQWAPSRLSEQHTILYQK